MASKGKLYREPYWANWGLDNDIIVLQHAIAGRELQTL